RIDAPAGGFANNGAFVKSSYYRMDFYVGYGVRSLLWLQMAHIPTSRGSWIEATTSTGSGLPAGMAGNGRNELPGLARNSWKTTDDRMAFCRCKNELWCDSPVDHRTTAIVRASHACRLEWHDWGRFHPSFRIVSPALTALAASRSHGDTRHA